MTEETDKDASAGYEGNGQRAITVTPKQLLVIILKVVFKDRTNDEEIERICSAYFKTLEELWGHEE